MSFLLANREFVYIDPGFSGLNLGCKLQWEFAAMDQGSKDIKEEVLSLSCTMVRSSSSLTLG
jgi:hypothetical protein